MLLALLLAPAQSLPTAPSGPDLTRYFVVCAGLLVVVLGVAWGFRRAFGRALSARAARRSLRVVDVLPLGGAKRLVVVHCYDRVFLVGQGEKELCAIAELDPDQTTPDAPAGVPRAAIEPGGRAGERRDAPQAGAGFAGALARAAQPDEPAAPRRPVLDDGRGVLG